MSSADFTPSWEDIIRARMRTTGIVQVEYEIKNVKFALLDAGGQRNERKKWWHGAGFSMYFLFCVHVNMNGDVFK